MFKFIRNNRRIRTKNLYCAELVRNEIIYHQNFNQTFKGIPFYPRKHVLVKKNECKIKQSDTVIDSVYLGGQHSNNSSAKLL